jgi:hypothetical protein
MNAYCHALGHNAYSCAQLQQGDLLFSVTAYAIMTALPLLLIYLLTINILDVFVNGWGTPGDPGPWIAGRMLLHRDILFPFFVMGWAWLVGCLALAART